MRRKLVKQGPATLTVSIPAEWVKANNLKQGDDVEVNVRENSIIVSCQPNEDTNAMYSLDTRSMGVKMLQWTLDVLYKKGAEEVRLTISEEQLPVIENRLTRNLMGFEIVQHKNNSVVIKFVTRLDAEELSTIIRRCFLVTLSLAEAVTKGNVSKDTLVLEETNNRLTHYCERIINKYLHKEKNAVFQYIIVWLVEKIADEYRTIIERNDFSIDDAIEANECCKEFYELNYKYSSSRHEALIQRIETGMKRKDNAFANIFHIMKQATGSLIAIHVERNSPDVH